MWPDTEHAVAELIADMRARAAARTAGRCASATACTWSFATPKRDARAPRPNASSAGSTPRSGDAIRASSLDSTSVGVRRQAELRDAATDDGFVEPNLWTGIGRARSGCGAAIVGDPDQVLAKLEPLPRRSASTPSSCPGTRTAGSAISSPSTCSPGCEDEPMTYTHGHHESVLRSHRWRTVENSAAYLAAAPRAGRARARRGCGPGHDHRRHRPPGRARARASASTRRPTSIAEAQHATPTASTTSSSRPATCTRSTYPDDAFDVVHAHQVLQHLPDPVGALREMRRVCKPDGVVAARDSDYAAFTLVPGRRRRSTRGSRCTATSPGPTAANPTPAASCSRGRTPPASPTSSPTASAWCFATPEDRAWWGDLWADRITDLGDRRAGRARRLRDPRRPRRDGRGLARLGGEPRRVVRGAPRRDHLPPVAAHSQ